MYRVAYNSPCPIQGTLKLTRNPFRAGLGHYKDTSGIVWDIKGIFSIFKDSFVQARRLSDAPSYYGTAAWDTQDGFHKWLPYRVEVK